MKKSLNYLTTGMAAACVLLSSQAFAEDAVTDALPVAYVEDVSPTQRINLSGKLRMLSQRIPAAACHYVAGIDPEGARALLASAEKEFHNILEGLEFGSAELGINGAEERRKTLAQLHELQKFWDPYEAAVDEVLAGNTDAAHTKSLITDSMAVLGSAKLLVSEISTQYSNPAEMTQSSAMVIDIAGRQRMLTQKMSKEACAAWSGMSETAAADLAGTMQMFDASLYALINGMPGAGIKKPTTAQIAEGLQVVYKDWTAVKDALTSISQGAKPAPEEAARIFQGLNKTMADMNKVVGMYAKAEKQEL